MKDKNVILINL